MFFELACVSIVAVNFVTPPKALYKGHIADKFKEFDWELEMAKKYEAVWKTKDGKKIEVATMEDSHLSNAIKMVCRSWGECGKLDKLKTNVTYKPLLDEAKKRKFVLIFNSSPNMMSNGRKEYVDVFIPSPRSKIAAGFFPTEWDSRPQE